MPPSRDSVQPLSHVGTLTRAREYFGDTRQPYALTVAGTKLYVLTSPDDVSAAYKNTVSLTIDEYIRDMMIQFGGSADAVEKMWKRPGISDISTPLIIPNPHHKSLAHLAEDLCRQQLYPGKHLDELQLKFIPSIHKAVHYDGIPSKATIAKQEPEKKVSLLRWKMPKKV